jgi:hypothetical protein
MSSAGGAADDTGNMEPSDAQEEASHREKKALPLEEGGGRGGTDPSSSKPVEKHTDVAGNSKKLANKFATQGAVRQDDDETARSEGKGQAAASMVSRDASSRGAKPLHGKPDAKGDQAPGAARSVMARHKAALRDGGMHEAQDGGDVEHKSATRPGTAASVVSAGRANKRHSDNDVGPTHTTGTIHVYDSNVAQTASASKPQPTAHVAASDRGNASPSSLGAESHDDGMQVARGDFSDEDDDEDDEHCAAAVRDSMYGTSQVEHGHDGDEREGPDSNLKSSFKKEEDVLWKLLYREYRRVCLALYIS